MREHGWLTKERPVFEEVTLVLFEPPSELS